MPEVSIKSELKPEDYWRAIVLFGRNVQSYKFSLARALLEMRPNAGDLLKLEDLAPVYSRHLVNHLRLCDKQGTSPSSACLDACRNFIAGELSESQLVRRIERIIELYFGLIILGVILLVLIFHNNVLRIYHQRDFIILLKLGLRLFQSLLGFALI